MKEGNEIHLTVSMLGLSPETYMFLVTNGIKSVSFLKDFSEEELFKLRMPYASYNSQSQKMKMIEEIFIKLKELESYGFDESSYVRKPLEVKITELNLQGRGEYRLQTNGIFTAGKLSTLSERNVLNMNAIGDKTLKEIKDSLKGVTGFTFDLSEEEMVCLGMPEEERDYYNKQKDIVDTEDAKRKEEKRFAEQESKESARINETVR